ncbi:MAG: nucleotidyl transferase AbiEii/AbiGii toxin family protein [Clostridia bacterium]|nr:nucleotidyl transferase AbiEii/AbiGii toxin family protein [Clostridia bacterium]
MQGNVMSFKAKINNISKEKKVAPQSVLQVYMLERLLERISVSKYKDNFILKGGMLISAILGMSSRSTMDMDTTVKGFELTAENASNILQELCAIELDDDITFEMKKIELIREDDDYNGYRATFEAKFKNSMPVIFKIDITTGDAITYKEIEYDYNLMLEDKKIPVWSYNLETILAEKFEAVIKRGIAGTRIRDFYDIYMLMATKESEINKKLLKTAINLTSEHRESLYLIHDWEHILEMLATDEDMRKRWKAYQKTYFYARDIKYDDLIKSIEKVGRIYNRYNKAETNKELATV